VSATAADVVVSFKDRDLLTFFGSLHRRPFTARAGPDYDHVKLSGFNHPYVTPQNWVLSNEPEHLGTVSPAQVLLFVRTLRI
jgi:hypothetical protein